MDIYEKAHPGESEICSAVAAVAAVVYDRAGLCEKQEVCDTMATEESGRILISLREVPVPDEANPVKVNGNC
ncbi:hypothetical protein MCG98_17475 [Ruminococcus sp. OA3]|uniref:hypothetical protein n=1 Tax=Ruminococcus sp. OA3 TaxID=2914164 RepID=UPI001F06CF26|nr:hypothetical protein [Ruminococcus sp. OA3]MCH1984362.1 hypothetical protein [Ruminococcus sp. OA3]